VNPAGVFTLLGLPHPMPHPVHAEMPYDWLAATLNPVS
jgi:hypothetical protein